MKKLQTLAAKGTLPRLSTGIIALTAWLFCPATTHAQGGVPLWTNIYKGPKWDVAVFSKIAVDKAGNIFVAATSVGGGYATLAYSNNGVPLWTNRYTGPLSTNYFDNVSAVAVDGSGNVFVTGSSDGIGTGPDYLTVGYSNSGQPLWTNRYNGIGSNLSDNANAIAVDGSGNIYVTGGSETSVFVADLVTIKYSNAGVPLWTNRCQGGQGSGASAIAVDNAGNVFITGTGADGANRHGYTTIKYSNSGVPLWTNRYGGPASSQNYARGITLDTAGNVFVTGSSTPQSGYSDYATIGYSNSGLPLWTNRFDGPLNRSDSPSAVTVDNSGNVFVTGTSVTTVDSITDYGDFATIKYSNSGLPLWTNFYDGPASQGDSAAAIAIDSEGNVFATGWSRNNLISESPPSWNYATIGYSNSGGPLWEDRYQGIDTVCSSAQAIALDPAGNVFVTGYSRGSDDYAYYTTIKYSSRIAPPVLLNFQRINNQLVLSWTNAGVHLQSAPLAGGMFTNIPGATSPYTNSLTAPRQFFRLVQ